MAMSMDMKSMATLTKKIEENMMELISRSLNESISMLVRLLAERIDWRREGPRVRG